MVMDRIVSYCECCEPGPVEFEKIEENDEYVIAKCTKCGKVTKFDWHVWYGVCPEDVHV